MKKLALGVDIGGTNTKFGFVDEKGKVYYDSSISTTEGGTFEIFLDNLYKAFEEGKKKLGPGYEFIGVGIGAPNANFYSGCIEFAPNLSWKGVVRVVDEVKKKFKLPAVITNDANAAAIGEMLFGAGKGMKNFIVITLGTGLGSGIVINGELVYGHDGFAGELGHVIVEENGRECGCGRKGCLEAYASATGLHRTIFELMADRMIPTVLRDYSYKEVTSAKIYEAAMDGDHLAREAFRKTGKILGKALANFVTFSSPEAIILFGGLAKAGELLRQPTEEAMEENMLHIFKNKVKVILSAFDESNAAVAGAAALAWKELTK